MKKHKKREYTANLIESMVGKNQTSQQLRATNRRLEKRKYKKIL